MSHVWRLDPTSVWTKWTQAKADLLAPLKRDAVSLDCRGDLVWRELGRGQVPRRVAVAKVARDTGVGGSVFAAEAGANPPEWGVKTVVAMGGAGS